MAHDVFISHSAKDKATADAVCATLEAEGIRCWIAPRDVTPGMEWGAAIIAAIKQARIMVLVFTANANASPQIRREVERAVNHDVVILPFRVENVIPDASLEYFIGNVHWLDALTPPMEAHLKNLTRTVKLLMTPAAEPQKPGAAEATASQPEITGARKPGERGAGGGASPHFRLWGVQAWTWAGGVLSVLLLGVVFVVVRSAWHPVLPGSAPPPQAVPEQAPPTGGKGGEPSEPGAGPAAVPPARTGRAAASAPSKAPPPAANVEPGRAPASAPPEVSPPAAELQEDADEAGKLIEQKRYAEAKPLAEKACDGGNMNGCSDLGFLYEHGEGVAQDYAQARSLYQEVCDSGNMHGCNNLGFLYEHGEGVAQDYAQARSLFQKACDGGNMHGCYNLGWLYQQGLGIAQDYAQARSLYQKACDGGVQGACDRLKSLQR